MIGILLAKVKLFIRKPWIFIAMTMMSVGFALILGGTNYTDINVPVYASDPDFRDSVVGELLEESDVYSFEYMTEEAMSEQITSRKADFGIKLMGDDFTVLVGIESPNVDLIQQTVQAAYRNQLQLEQILIDSDVETIGKQEVEQSLDSPSFMIEANNFRGSDAVLYDNTFQTLFGFTLFLVIYTIAYNVLHILEEKSNGIWDRVILSPVKKWKVYMANFFYSFVVGYIQIAVIFLVFRYWFQLDFNGEFLLTFVFIIPYVFSIVALAILITGIAKTVQQFNTIIPFIAVSMAMIGGAFWPLEVVDSSLMLFLAKIVPLTYGMEILNGIVVYGYSMEELLLPVSILLLIGVLMAGIGIHLMEKRYI